MNDTRDLTKRLAELLRREHGALADFLVALADFDRERRWVELGHTSLFYFLHRELGLSKGAAFYRKTAAELIQRYPEVVEPLREGKLCITSVVELAKVITPENRGEVVPRFFHASKREAKAVAAELRPAEAAPHRDVVTVPQLAAPAKAVTRLEVATWPATPGAVVQPDEPRGEVPASPPSCRRLRLPRPPGLTRSSRSPVTCAGSTPPCPSAFSPSWPRRAMRSRTAIPEPTPRRCWKPPSTSSSRRTTRRRGS